MGEFFKGKRRKMGMLTLLMALGFMAGWVRSRTFQDEIYFHSGKHTTQVLYSVNCVIVWQRSHFANRENSLKFPKWRTYELYPDSTGFDETGMVWCWRWCGFGYGELPSDLVEGLQETYLFVPYYSFVISLTLMSAFLLLTNPNT